MTRRSRIVGTGAALPPRRVTNAELAERIDTTHQWIVERTGIEARHIAADGETTATLATEAAKKALEAAGVEPGQIGLIVLATATPDQTFPSSATKVQAALGINDCVAFDVHAVCTGFLYALSVADSMLRSGNARKALVIGSETFSRILDWEDRATCVLFGDGAGALVLSAEETDGGILATRLHADGRHNDLLFVDGGPSTTGTVGKLRMKGREVFRHAVVNLAGVLNEVLDAAGLTADEVDWVVPHQANARILDATARKLGLPPEKIIVTVHEHANTSAASVPLAFDTAVKDGRIKRGDLIDIVHRKLGLSRAESAYIVERILHHMCHGLSQGENVKISGFGTFILRDKGQRIGRNPKTGVEVPIAPRRVMTFRASQIMRDRVAK
jgi:3-oxoacyl-[acyl-carrier-protein] synthase III